MAIATTLAVILAATPVGAFEVRPDKKLTGDLVGWGTALRRVARQREPGSAVFSTAGRNSDNETIRVTPGTYPDYEQAMRLWEFRNRIAA